MPDTSKLKTFHVEEAGDGFTLQIEDESGNMLDLQATREQIDLIVDNLDELLSTTEEADEVDAEAEA